MLIGLSQSIYFDLGSFKKNSEKCPSLPNMTTSAKTSSFFKPFIAELLKDVKWLKFLRLKFGIIFPLKQMFFFFLNFAACWPVWLLTDILWKEGGKKMWQQLS